MRGPSRFDVLIFLIWCAIAGAVLIYVVDHVK